MQLYSLPYNNDEVENAVKDDPTIETRLIKAVDDVMNTHGSKHPTPILAV